MKTWLILLTLLPFLGFGNVWGQSTKAEKAEQQIRLFQETRKLIESNHFKITIERVFPQNGMDMTRFNPRGEIVITDTIAKGNLPYFGRAYSLPYGEGGGIEFDGPMKNQTIKVIEKKKKKMVTYDFSIRGANDIYQIHIEVVPGGNCNINLNSNNRAHISYTGNVFPLEEK